MTICIGKVRIKSKMKNTNNNYLNLTAYCVEWSQNVKWIELDHSRNRIVSRIVSRYKMNKMSTEFFQFFFFHRCPSHEPDNYFLAIHNIFSFFPF